MFFDFIKLIEGILAILKIILPIVAGAPGAPLPPGGEDAERLVEAIVNPPPTPAHMAPSNQAKASAVTRACMAIALLDDQDPKRAKAALKRLAIELPKSYRKR